MVTNFFSTIQKDRYYFGDLIFQDFFFIDSNRGLAAGLNKNKEFYIMRYINQPYDTQNLQQRNYFYTYFE